MQSSGQNLPKFSSFSKKNFSLLKTPWKEFPGGPVVDNPCFLCRGMGLIPGQGTKIPQLCEVALKKDSVALTVILLTLI